MTQVSDVTTILTTGFNYIDALLDSGPQWNYLTPTNNTLSYTFSTASGNESGVYNQQAFDSSQMAAAREILTYITTLTGITFSETTDGSTAKIHFSLIDINGASTAGLSSWSSSYLYNGSNTITSYSLNAYVYLDNAEWLSQNSNLTAGSSGYQTLLHEMGHTLGLKHPFEGSSTLPNSQDNTANTLMSYTPSGGPYSSFNAYDIAALNWIYGGDGLGGALGIGSTGGGRYWTGSSDSDAITAGSSNDTLKGEAGNDTLNGGAGSDYIDGSSGIDKAVYSNARSQYTISSGSSYSVIDSSNNDADTLSNVERLQFSDVSVAIDLDAGAGITAKILGAVFGASSLSNKTYAGIGLSYLDAGTSYQDLMQLALNVKLGTGFSNVDEVNLLYQNVIGSLPSSADQTYWVGTITSGQYSQASLAVMAADTSYNTTNIDLVGLAGTGLEYV